MLQTSSGIVRNAFKRTIDIFRCCSFLFKNILLTFWMHSLTIIKRKLMRNNLWYFFFTFFRLVINLMTINVASCLLLFPAIIYDMQMSSGYSNSKTISFLNPMNNSKNNDGDDSISNNLNIIDDSYSNIHSGKNTEYTVYCYVTIRFYKSDNLLWL